jgi:hypothetical protein
MANILSQLERQYFVRKLGVVEPKERIESIKRRYFITQIAPAQQYMNLYDLEWDWMVKFLTDNSIPQTGDEEYQAMWQLMVRAIGQVPLKYINDNQIIFYKNAP